MAPLRVFIVADDPLARTGLASLLAPLMDDLPGAAVVGQDASGADLPGTLAAAGPDAIVWDLGPDPTDALDQMAAMETTGAPIVALIAHEADAADAVAAGARGALLRDVEAPTLLAALQGAVRGLLVLDPSLASAVMPARDRESAPPEELTPRELEVLQLLAEGLPNKQVAQRLGVSEHTVKFHVNAILSKLDAHSRTEAVTRAARLGLIIL